MEKVPKNFAPKKKEKKPEFEEKEKTNSTHQRQRLAHRVPRRHAPGVVVRTSSVPAPVVPDKVHVPGVRNGLGLALGKLLHRARAEEERSAPRRAREDLLGSRVDGVDAPRVGVHGNTPREQTVSTKSRVPVSRQRSPKPARDWCTPVLDSPWHRNRTAGLCSLREAAIWSLVSVLPVSHLRSTALAPKRELMSSTRWPQIPAFPTTIVSPGSSRLVMQASIPPWPVPETIRTFLESVWGFDFVRVF